MSRTFGKPLRHTTAVDLFAGCGGLTEGLLAAGVRVAASVELHPQPALTSAFNHPETQVLVGDIRELKLDVLDDAISKSAPHRNIDLVVGGPPCQGFSSAGKKSVADPRNSLFRSFVDVIDHLRPRMFLMENVPGFKSRYNGAVYAEAAHAFSSRGYEFIDEIVLAKSYGVPQRRQRFVMVGWLPGQAKPFAWPNPTHGAKDDLFEYFLPPFVTAGEALDDLSFVGPGQEATRYQSPAASEFARGRRNGGTLVFNQLATRHRDRATQMFSQIAEGRTIRDVDDSIKSGKVTMARLNRNAISNTVLSLPDDLLHYSHDRILSVREAARLQTFDDDFVFLGKRTSGFTERRVDVPQYTQVGNAVPPQLAKSLGEALQRSLDGTIEDARDIKGRRRRHAFVRGSSAYSGYTLDPEIATELELRTVAGVDICLPIAEDELLVADQAHLQDWTRRPRTQRRQWAPGVLAKDQPSWLPITN